MRRRELRRHPHSAREDAPDYEPAAYELAIYEEIEGEPGRYELEWFSERGRLPGDAFPVLTAPGSARECAAGFGTAGCA